jgi:hypothetical protein
MSLLFFFNDKKIDGYYRWGRKPGDDQHGFAENKVWKPDHANQSVVDSCGTD